MGGKAVWWTYGLAFAMTLSVVLGIGFLALPTRLTNSGLAPFLATFAANLVVQLVILVASFDIIQRGMAFLYASGSGQDAGVGSAEDPEPLLQSDHPSGDERSVTRARGDDSGRGLPADSLLVGPGNQGDADEDFPSSGTGSDSDTLNNNNNNSNFHGMDQSGDMNMLGNGDDIGAGGVVIGAADAVPVGVGVADGISRRDTRTDLRALSRLFLRAPLPPVFEAIVFVHLVALLISYSVAAGAALSQVLGAAPWATTLFFSLGMTLAVITADRHISRVMSGMTLMKGTLLVTMVGLVAYVASVVSEPPPPADWSKIVQPVVLGTLAIGGAVNCQPLLFRELERACGWCDPCALPLKPLLAFSSLALVVATAVVSLFAHFILRIVDVERLSEGVSTVAVREVIEDKFDNLAWGGTVISMFVIVSLTVSYLSLGLSTKHIVDGVNRDREGIASLRAVSARLGERNTRHALYAVTFGLVAVIAVANPGSFMVVMENLGTITLNLEVGPLLYLMLRAARRKVPESTPGRTRVNVGGVVVGDGAGRDAEDADLSIKTYDLALRIPASIEYWMASVAVYLSVIAAYSTVRFFMILAGEDAA